MPAAAPSVEAVLLIAHGSRRPEANDDLSKLAELVRRRGSFPIVEIAYLELADPDIPAGAARCVERGATRVRMLPYFLSAGAHVTQDLESFRDELTQIHPGTRFELCPPIGLHPLIVEIVLDRLGRPSDFAEG